MSTWIQRVASLVAAVVFVLACGEGDENSDSVAHAAEALVDHECEICGMSVVRQPAPRAQAIHRDGTRLFFCSIGDWQVHLAAPSPHGRVVTSFVEVVGTDEGLLSPNFGPHPWLRAQDASYVVDIERPGIMGKPVLAHRSRAAAEAVRDTLPGAQIVDLAGLESWWVGATE